MPHAARACVCVCVSMNVYVSPISPFKMVYSLFNVHGQGHSASLQQQNAMLSSLCWCVCVWVLSAAFIFPRTLFERVCVCVREGHCQGGSRYYMSDALRFVCVCVCTCANTNRMETKWNCEIAGKIDASRILLRFIWMTFNSWCPCNTGKMSQWNWTDWKLFGFCSDSNEQPLESEKFN